MKGAQAIYSGRPVAARPTGAARRRHVGILLGLELEYAGWLPERIAYSVGAPFAAEPDAAPLQPRSFARFRTIERAVCIRIYSQR